MSRPSERAIAAAFRELIASPEHEWPAFPETFRDAVERRAAELDASGPQGAEAVAWQVRYVFSDGRWSGWAQQQSQAEAEYLVSRYAKDQTQAEWRPLYTRPPVERAPRYFCDGPNGYFYCDDIDTARRIVNIVDPEGEDWTITDTLNPLAAPSVAQENAP